MSASDKAVFGAEFNPIVQEVQKINIALADGNTHRPTAEILTRVWLVQYVWVVDDLVAHFGFGRQIGM